MLFFQEKRLISQYKEIESEQNYVSHNNSEICIRTELREWT